MVPNTYSVVQSEPGKRNLLYTPLHHRRHALYVAHQVNWVGGGVLMKAGASRSIAGPRWTRHTLPMSILFRLKSIACDDGQYEQV
jgi:hypothetical protein